MGGTGKKARMYEEEGRNFGHWCQCLVGRSGRWGRGCYLSKIFLSTIRVVSSVDCWYVIHFILNTNTHGTRYSSNPELVFHIGPRDAKVDSRKVMQRQKGKGGWAGRQPTLFIFVGKAKSKRFVRLTSDRELTWPWAAELFLQLSVESFSNFANIES